MQQISRDTLGASTFIRPPLHQRITQRFISSIAVLEVTAVSSTRFIPSGVLMHSTCPDTFAKSFLEDRTNSTVFHSDVTYENQPPGTTFLYVLDSPTAGGDTLFSNMAEAYNRLSPGFRNRLEGLKAVHTGMDTLRLVILQDYG